MVLELFSAEEINSNVIKHTTYMLFKEFDILHLTDFTYLEVLVKVLLRHLEKYEKFFTNISTGEL